jgi:vacuolar protein sorting-associated protein 13A/C
MLRENGNNIKVKLNDMSLCMIDEFLTNNTSKIINVLSPTNKSSKDPLIELNMASKPIDTPHIDTVVVAKMRSVRFDYNPYLVIRAVAFFDVKVKDD